MKKKIAIFLACLLVLSSVITIGASASESPRSATSGNTEKNQTVVPGETDWRDNPYDTGHCCIDESYPEPDSSPYLESETDPGEDETNSCGETDGTSPSDAPWINDPQDTGHCTIDVPGTPSETESATSRPAWMDDPQDTGHCTVDVPSAPSETESATSRPAWMDDPQDTGHCTIDVPGDPSETESGCYSDIEGDTSHCEEQYPQWNHHYSDIEDETCFCGEHHPLTSKPTEPPTTDPCVPTDICVINPTETVYYPQETEPERELTPREKYTSYLYEKRGTDVEVDLFEKLGGDCYLTHCKLNASNPVSLVRCVDKYICVMNGSDKDVFVYSVKKNKEYELDTAYEKGIVSKEGLKRIKKLLSGNSLWAEFRENTCVLNAGETAADSYGAAYDKGFFLNSDSVVGKMMNSDPSVVKYIKDKSTGGGYLVGLKKGTAVLSYKLKSGKQISCKVTVKSSPRLSKKTVAVKKGKTVTLKIIGRAAMVDNTYYNTSTARVVSKRNTDKLKIKGLKRGTTSLKIKVNGAVLKLKVNVK